MFKLFLSGVRSAVKNAVIGGMAEGIQEVLKNLPSQPDATPEVEQVQATLLAYFPNLAGEGQADEEPKRKARKTAS